MKISRQEFIQSVTKHIADGQPYAAAKFSHSDQQLLFFPILRPAIKTPRQLIACLAHLKFHGEKQSGIFPITESFLTEYCQFYGSHLRNIDVVGLLGLSGERELIEFWQPKGQLIDSLDQEPDRSIPSSEENCYLPSFRGKRVVIVSPFAKIICERGNKEIFEAVWRKTGKRWFYPSVLLPLTIPLGALQDTQRKFGNVINLYQEICSHLSKIDFDIALIGAGGLGIPISSHVKSVGKIAISIGGHIQVVFGIIGERWRQRADWAEMYFTDAWIDMPKGGLSDQLADIADRGAYW